MVRILKKKLKISLAVVALILAVALLLNIILVVSASRHILSEKDYENALGVDCILVLGCGLINGEPGLMLSDRLDRAIELYNLGFSDRILVSGDHGMDNYDEVNVMKSYCVEKGIPSEDVFMDHAGFSTYDSMYRAKQIFQVNSCVVVTQEYHLYRAVYIGRSLGIEAYGVAAEDVYYSGQFYRCMREILARDKDFIKSLFKPASSIGGDIIDISGNGDITNDK